MDMRPQAGAGLVSKFAVGTGNGADQSRASSLLPPGEDRGRMKEAWDEDVSLDDVGFPGTSGGMGRNQEGGAGRTEGGGRWAGDGAGWRAPDSYNTPQGREWSSGRPPDAMGGNWQKAHDGREDGVRGFGGQDDSQKWFADTARAWNRGNNFRGKQRGKKNAGIMQGGNQMQRGSSKVGGAGHFVGKDKQDSALAGTEEESFYCDLCDVHTTGLQNLQMHKDGQRHKANVARQQRGEQILKGPRNRAPGKKRKLTSDGSEIHEIQPVIDSCLEPIVGLELVIEYFRQEWQTESIFYCTLCETRIAFASFIPHVTGYRHRYAYIKLKRPEAQPMCRVESKDREVTTTTETGEVVTRKIEKRNRTEVSANITRVCLDIISEEGMKKMQKGVDPDPPEMPINRLKKTMRSDSRMEMRALNPDDFKKPVSYPAPVPFNKRKRMAPKNSRDNYDESPRGRGRGRGRGRPPFNKNSAPPFNKNSAPPFRMRPGAKPPSASRGSPRQNERPFPFRDLMRERQTDLWAMEEELMFRRWRLAMLEEEERQYQRPLGMRHPRGLEEWQEPEDRGPFHAPDTPQGRPPPFERKSFLDDRPRVSETLKDLYEAPMPPRWSMREGPVMRRNLSEME